MDCVSLLGLCLSECGTIYKINHSDRTIFGWVTQISPNVACIVLHL